MGVGRICVNSEEWGQCYKIEWNLNKGGEIAMHVVFEEQKRYSPGSNPSNHVMPQ